MEAPTGVEERWEILNYLDDGAIDTRSINVAVINPNPSYDALCRLCQALEHHDRLITLNLWGVLVANNMLPIIPLIQRHSSLQELRLGDNRLGPNEGIVLAHSLGIHLRVLDLSDNAIGNLGAAAFENSDIEELHLNNNGIGDDGAVALARNNRVQKLMLRANKIGEIGAMALTGALLRGSIRQSGLRDLNLSRNNFVVDSILSAIGAFLENHRPLERVDFVVTLNGVSTDTQQRASNLRTRLNLDWLSSRS